MANFGSLFVDTSSEFKPIQVGVDSGIIEVDNNREFTSPRSTTSSTTRSGFTRKYEIYMFPTTDEDFHQVCRRSIGQGAVICTKQH